MFDEYDRVGAVKMSEISATQALFVEVTAAVAVFAYILIYVAIALLVAELSQDLVLAKLC